MNSKALLKKAGYKVVKHQPHPEWSDTPISSYLPHLRRVAADLEVDLPHQEPWKDGEYNRTIRLSVDIEAEVCKHYSGNVNIYIAKFRMSFFNGTYYTDWAGSSSLASNKPFVPSVVKEISEAKGKELEAAREKRRHIIKNNMDAVRLLLENSQISCSRIAGAVRVYADMNCSIDFIEQKNSTKIRVVFTYEGGGHTQHRDIAILDLANPNFGELALIIVHNFSYMWNIIIGKKQLKPMPFKIGQ